MKKENNKNSFWLENRKLFTVESVDPLIVEINSMTVDKNNRNFKK